MIRIISGVVLGFLLLSFVNKLSLFGKTCYYVGSLELDSTCVKPFVYYGAWLLAIVLVAWGAWSQFGDKAKQEKSHENDSEEELPEGFVEIPVAADFPAGVQQAYEYRGIRVFRVGEKKFVPENHEQDYVSLKTIKVVVDRGDVTG